MAADVNQIRQAMNSNPPQMIGFSYTKKKESGAEEYVVEPYDVREYTNVFYGYKINDEKPGIRKFFLSNMANVQILPQVFSPRWELYPFGKE